MEKQERICVKCGGEDEYEELCQECLGDGCDFCHYVGSIWVPCYTHEDAEGNRWQN